MKAHDHIPVVKGMIFAGCSFTWGQGLYYYSNLPTLKEPLPHHYDADLVKFTHYEYMRSVRYPRLVASHFKQFEVCQPFNGGASYSIHQWWEECFNKFKSPDPEREKSVNGDYYHQKYDYEDFSHIFYQFTQWTRGHSPAMICRNSDGAIVRTMHYSAMQNENFPQWLEENNLTLEQYIDRGKRREIEDAKNFLKKFEENGVKVYVVSWPFDIVDYIKNDPWLAEKLIEFDYLGTHYTNIESMMAWSEDVRPELTIAYDRSWFKEPPSDHHPSLDCHRVIADSIIRHLEKEQNERTQTNAL